MALAEHSLPQQLAVERCRQLAIDALGGLLLGRAPPSRPRLS
jgi:hypothetical protein